MVAPLCQFGIGHHPRFATPRVVAGEAISTDNMECQLKPLERSAYGTITFTEEQWKSLQQTFPKGVCDFSKKGVLQKGTVPRTLSDLVSQGLVDRSYLSDPWARPFHYALTDIGYLLSAVDDAGKKTGPLIERVLPPKSS